MFQFQFQFQYWQGARRGYSGRGTRQRWSGDKTVSSNLVQVVNRRGGAGRDLGVPDVVLAAWVSINCTLAVEIDVARDP